MHLIESWGIGIRRIIEDCAQLNLPEPVFLKIGDAFRVEAYRKQATQLATGQASTEQVTEERIIELVEYCSTPRKRSEMQSFLGLTHREHFRETILQPLIDKSLIQPTIPDKPTSSYQRYVKVNMET